MDERVTHARRLCSHYPSDVGDVVANPPPVPQRALDRGVGASKKGGTADAVLEGNSFELRNMPSKPETPSNLLSFIGEDGHAEGARLVDAVSGRRLMLEGDEQERGFEGNRTEPRCCQPAALASVARGDQGHPRGQSSQ